MDETKLSTDKRGICRVHSQSKKSATMESVDRFRNGDLSIVVDFGEGKRKVLYFTRSEANDIANALDFPLK